MLNPRTILVHEYVSGGGCPDMPDLPSLTAEGETMLRAVLADFMAWGQARIVTTRDARLSGPPFEADAVIPLEPGDYAARFPELAKRADAVMVIAPEERWILGGLSEQVLTAGARLLGSLPEGVRAAGDKWVCQGLLDAAGLPAPETILACPGQARQAALDLGLPAVLKSIDGQGSLGVCLASDSASLDQALELLGQTRPLLVQPYHSGLHASVSLLASASGVLPLCVNGQDMRPGIPFSYQGGWTPLEHPAAPEAAALATAAARAVPGLRGFVGVDLVLTHGLWRVIEVNPRLTVAYAGVRHILDLNLAEAIVRACLDDILPETVTISGRTEFGRKENRRA